MTAQEKLVEARRAMEKFKKAEDPQDIKSEFYKAVAALKTAAGRLEAESKTSVQGLPDAKVRRAALTEWWKLEAKRQRADGVIGWVFKARDSDHHEVASGEHLRIGGHTKVDRLFIGAKGPENVSINGAGVFATTFRGTPREESSGYPHRGSTIVQSSLSNPPTTHLGKPLDRKVSPEALLKMAWDYFEKLWYLSKSNEFGDYVQRDLRKSRKSRVG